MVTCKCYRCHETKPAEEFAWRRKHRGQRDSFCRPCRAAYKQEHYQANKERYIAQAAARKKRLILNRMAFLLKYFGSHPCVDCSEQDPLVLEFDHLRDKKFDISQALHSRSWTSIIDEIAKCEVVCANCHRRRTARRARSIKFVLIERAAKRKSGRPDLNRHRDLGRVLCSRYTTPAWIGNFRR